MKKNKIRVKNRFPFQSPDAFFADKKQKSQNHLLSVFVLLAVIKSKKIKQINYE